ncbi:hypothetical protein [Pseudomonas alabamensis]|uniref:hypothetical protein n=1 Tax=Pseudomonas alabamensis TaxID=3064349 RepID=UPI0021D93255|nr:hypothetical protein [Pseudomonas entomophila]
MAAHIEISEIINITYGLIAGSAFSVVGYVWRGWRESKREARSNYDNALGIASQNRDLANDSVIILNNIILKLKALPKTPRTEKAIAHFQKAYESIAQPNSKTAQEFYDSIYSYEKEMKLGYSREVLKKANHIFRTNNSANHSISKQLDAIMVYMEMAIETETSGS